MSFREVQIGPCRLICADCMDVLPTWCQDAVVGTWIYTGERLDEVVDGMKQI